MREREGWAGGRERDADTDADADVGRGTGVGGVSDGRHRPDGQDSMVICEVNERDCDQGRDSTFVSVSSASTATDSLSDSLLTGLGK